MQGWVRSCPSWADPNFTIPNWFQQVRLTKSMCLCDCVIERVRERKGERENERDKRLFIFIYSTSYSLSLFLSTYLFSMLYSLFSILLVAVQNWLMGYMKLGSCAILFRRVHIVIRRRRKTTIINNSHSHLNEGWLIHTTTRSHNHTITSTFVSGLEKPNWSCEIGIGSWQLTGVGWVRSCPSWADPNFTIPNWFQQVRLTKPMCLCDCVIGREKGRVRVRER